MIEKREKLLTLSQAARLEWLPERRFGKRLAPSSLFRWARSGCRGVRLEVVRVAGSLCTTEAALMRFFQRLALVDGGATIDGDTQDTKDGSSAHFLNRENI